MNIDQANIEAAKTIARIFLPEVLLKNAILDIKEMPDSEGWALLFSNDEVIGKVTISSKDDNMVLHHEPAIDTPIMDVVIETPLTGQTLEDAFSILSQRNVAEADVLLSAEVESE